MRGVPGLKIRPAQGRPEALRACHWNQRKKPQRAPRVGAFPPRARGPARPLGLIKAVGLTFCNAPAPGPPIFWRLSAQPRDKTFFFLKRCARRRSRRRGARPRARRGRRARRPPRRGAGACRLRGTAVRAAGTVADGLVQARAAAGVDDLILVCGSLFTVGEARSLLTGSAYEPFRG